MKSWHRSSTDLRTEQRNKWALLAAAVLLAAMLSFALGPVLLSPETILRVLLGGERGTAAAGILLYVRLPRTCGSLLAGAALAVSGVIIQSVLSNPLAAPNVIGVNAGAGLMTAVCCALLPNAVRVMPAAAFCGAFLGVMLVLTVAERAGAARITLVLAGVAISAMFSAGIDLVVTLVPDALVAYSDFRIGGFSNLTMTRLVFPGVMIAVSLTAALIFSNELDVLTLGGEMAQSLGLRVRRVRMGMLALAAALAGAAVSFAGLLGFVGLIVPHIMRRVMGEESKTLILSSALGGAALLTFCDLGARTLFAPYEIPVGIVMSLVGGPFFLWLLFRQRGGRVHD